MIPAVPITMVVGLRALNHFCVLIKIGANTAANKAKNFSGVRLL